MNAVENLPVIEIKNGKYLVVGKIDRNAAHTNDISLHATALIVALTPNLDVLLADITQKKKAKANIRQDGTQVSDTYVDCFGGHLTYDAVPMHERAEGISQDTFLSCAMKELSEELVIKKGKQTSVLPLEKDQFIFLGMSGIDRPHNKEISAAFLYTVQPNNQYVSNDTLVYPDGRKIVYEQPIHYVPLKKIITEKHPYKLGDGIARLIDQLSSYYHENTDTTQ